MDNYKILQYLQTEFTEPIRDPLWKNILFSKAFLQIIGTKEFQRLSHIRQLGPTYQVYPGATHSRLNHSLGVFHIASKFITALLSKFDTHLFTFEGVKAFLAASLLHDLGHFPYTHSLKGLPLTEHEELTAEIILSSSIKDILRDKIGTDPYVVASIIDEQLKHEDKEIAIYRNMLSGALDPDKLDYLNRDAYFCGIPYGLQDIDFILSQIVPHQTQGLALHHNGITAVENILFSKYLMYKNVYWHRTVRSATAMIKKALIMGLMSNSIKPTDLYYLDDDQFYNLFSKTSYKPFQLIENVFNRDFYKICFQDDFVNDPKTYFHFEVLDNRLELESRIAMQLSKKYSVNIRCQDIIIDIPEKINFEIDLPLYNNQSFISFKNCDTIFSPKNVLAYSQTLRKFRILMPGQYSGLIEGKNSWKDLIQSVL